MAMQQQNSSFAARLGGHFSAAIAEHRDKPVDLGNRRLPPGIKGGIAKISAMYTKEQTEDGKGTPKGQVYFYCGAVCVSPKDHDGQKCEGLQLFKIVSLCEIPAKKTAWGESPAVSLRDNIYEFQNLFKLLGVPAPDVNEKTDPDGKKGEAYYFAAMAALTNPQRPVYIKFSTRAWKSPQRPNESAADYQKREPMVFEEWEGLADAATVAQMNRQHDPGAGVVQRSTLAPPPVSVAAAQPAPFQEPPQGVVVRPENDTHAHTTLPPITNAEIHSMSPDAVQPRQSDGTSLDDEVTVLVESAMDDPEGATEEGQAAHARLEELAWAAGWTREQTASAENWAAVGNMAIGGAPTSSTPVLMELPLVVVGSRWKFCKRAKDGEKLKNNKGVEFPPLDVEVTSVDPTTKVCTVKTVKDGKDVVDVRSKQPIAVKWEWLET